MLRAARASCSRRSACGCAPSTTSRCSPRSACCNGIENYTMHLDGRHRGEPPLHPARLLPRGLPARHRREPRQAVPQLHGQYEGDRSRKDDAGRARLPPAVGARTTGRCASRSSSSGSARSSSCRPRPGPYELRVSRRQVVEQIVRPTGLVDPEVIVQPTKGQIDDLIEQINERVDQGRPGARHHPHQEDGRGPHRLPARAGAAGALPALRHRHHHSASRSCATLRLGEFDVLVGINLLREGLDLPEVSLVAILDADKEGFLRSRDRRSSRPWAGPPATSTARSSCTPTPITDSMQHAISETQPPAGSCSWPTTPSTASTRRPSARRSPTSSRSIRCAPATRAATGRPGRGRGRGRRARTGRAGADLADAARSDELGRPDPDASRRRCTRPPRELRFEEAARLRDEIDELQRELRDGRADRSTAATDHAWSDRRRHTRLAPVASPSMARHARRPRRARAQPAQHLARAAARPADRLHRAVGLGQVVAGLRHHLRRGPAPLRRVAVAPTPGSSSARWTSPTSTSSRACRRPSRSTRSRRRATRARRSAPITEIYDYLRLLYARIGRAALPRARRPAGQRQTPAADRRPRPRAARGHPLPGAGPGRAGPQGRVRGAARRPGQAGLRPGPGRRRDRRARPSAPSVDAGPLRAAHHRGRRRPAGPAATGIERRLTDSLETALQLAEGVAEVELVPREGEDAEPETLTFSQHLACPTAGSSLRGAGAPQLLVQLALRRVPGVRRPRHAASRSTPSWSCPTPTCRSPRARSRRGAAARSEYFSRMLEAVAEDVRLRPRHAVGEADQGRSRRCCSTARARAGARSSTRTATAASAVLRRSYEGVIPWLKRRHADAESRLEPRADRDATCARCRARRAAAPGSSPSRWR